MAFPLETLGADVLREILRGGGDAAAEAGVAVLGGHSIDDPEPKYGMAVTGTVAPGRGSHERRRTSRATRSSSPSRSARARCTTATKRGAATAPTSTPRSP